VSFIVLPENCLRAVAQLKVTRRSAVACSRIFAEQGTVRQY